MEANEEFNQYMAFAGSCLLLVTTLVTLVGLVMRIRHTWRLDKRRREVESRSSSASICSSESGEGGFDTIVPRPMYQNHGSLTSTPLSLESFYFDNNSICNTDQEYSVSLDIEKDKNTGINVFNYFNTADMSWSIGRGGHQRPGHQRYFTQYPLGADDENIYWC